MIVVLNHGVTENPARRSRNQISTAEGAEERREDKNQNKDKDKDKDLALFLCVPPRTLR